MENYENSPTYQRWASEQGKQVPLTELRTLIAIFMADAEINMGSTADEKTLDRCIWHAGNKYGHLPIAYIASGYARGSMGDFGTGRLTPNTIKKWMDQVNEEYLRDETKAKLEQALKNPGVAMDLHKYPAGKAIIKKVAWLNSGAITSEEYDQIPLKELARRIAAGEPAEIADFIPR